MQKKIMLVDGNSIINRAFYALPNLTGPSGEPTGGVYGFLNIFFKMYDEEKPDYAAVAFDLPKPTFRHEMYTEYKGTRKPMPDALRPQLPLLKEILAKMGVSIFEKGGLEADDILGSLAAAAEKKGLLAVIVSGDSDLLQTVTDSVKLRLHKTKKGQPVVESYYAKDVYESFGVTPLEYIEVKALMGDRSDNIPGVPGIGEITAYKIISEYKSIANAITHADEIKPKRAGDSLAAHADAACLSKELASIVKDADIPLPGVSVTEEAFYSKEVTDMFLKLGFKTFINRASAIEAKGVSAADISLNYTYCGGKDEINALFGALKEADVFACALINYDGCDAGFGFYLRSEGYFMPFSFLDAESDERFHLRLAEAFNSGKKIIAFDSKKILHYFLKRGITIEAMAFDTTLAAYLLNSSKAEYDYSSIGFDWANSEYPSFESLFGKGKSKKAYNAVDRGIFTAYAARHAEAAFKSYEAMNNNLKENLQDKLYYDIELPTALCLADMEKWGIKVDKAVLLKYDSVLAEKIDGLKKNIYDMAGEEFNVNSPMQLGRVLFEKMGLKGGKKTKTGYSTAADVLEKLKSTHPIIDNILLNRTLSKLKSTYCDGLLSVLDPETERIYSTFNQTVTSTGRLSSSEPNLQNIPVRTELGRLFRKVFVPEDGFVFLDADYSQIELRILAHMSGDGHMTEAFVNGGDIHSVTAARINGVPLEMVTPAMRSGAKAVNFGIVYGIGGFSLSEDLGISVKEAEDYINAYLGEYSGVKKFMADSVAFAKKYGYAKTMFGRRREIPEINDSKYNIRSFGERAAMNMPIQGSAADIMKLAMINVCGRIKACGLKSRVVLQVHDELLVEAHESEKDIVSEILKGEMEKAVTLSVPLIAEVNAGYSWFETK